MTLVPPNPEYQFIQNTEPSNPKQSDWWLDTSVNPPKSKVYDGSGFVEPQSISYVDQQVSTAGASVSDIESGAEDALEEDISNLSPASNSVAAILDGGVAAVDWSSKTGFFTDTVNNRNISAGAKDSLISVSGSGYLTHVVFKGNSSWDNQSRRKPYIDIDGTEKYRSNDEIARQEYFVGADAENILEQIYSGPVRFNTSFELGDLNTAGGDRSIEGYVGVTYVLD